MPAKSNILHLPPVPMPAGCSQAEQALKAMQDCLAHHFNAAIVAIEEARNAALERIPVIAPQDRLYTVKQAAAYLQLSERTIHRMSAAGNIKLSFFYAGNEKRFRISDLDRYLKRVEAHKTAMP